MVKMNSDLLFIVGAIITAAGILLLAVTQIILWKKIRDFNREWEAEQDEMS